MSQIENSDEIYYHYTSIHAFYNIISSKSLWLTSLKTSNDKEELYFNITDFSLLLDYIINNFPKNFEEQNFFEKFKILYNSYKNNKEKANDLNNSLVSEPYGICFTSLKDSLAHWSLYGSSMKGICFGISYPAYLKIYDNPESYNSIINSDEIHYKQSKIINTILYHLNLFCSFFDYLSPVLLEDFLKKNGWILCVNTLNYIKNFIKKEGYSVEHESRLFYDKQIFNRIQSFCKSAQGINYTAIIDNFDCLNREIIKKLKIENNVSYAVFHNQIRAYQSINLGNIWSSALIPEVILGPTCTQDIEELERFLKANGLMSTQIIKSTIPLR